MNLIADFIGQKRGLVNLEKDSDLSTEEKLRNIQKRKRFIEHGEKT